LSKGKKLRKRAEKKRKKSCCRRGQSRKGAARGGEGRSRGKGPGDWGDQKSSFKLYRRVGVLKREGASTEHYCCSSREGNMNWVNWETLTTHSGGAGSVPPPPKTRIPGRINHQKEMCSRVAVKINKKKKKKKPGGHLSPKAVGGGEKPCGEGKKTGAEKSACKKTPDHGNRSWGGCPSSTC